MSPRLIARLTALALSLTMLAACGGGAAANGGGGGGGTTPSTASDFSTPEIDSLTLVGTTSTSCGVYFRPSVLPTELFKDSDGSTFGSSGVIITDSQVPGATLVDIGLRLDPSDSAEAARDQRIDLTLVNP